MLAQIHFSALLVICSANKGSEMETVWEVLKIFGLVIAYFVAVGAVFFTLKLWYGIFRQQKDIEKAFQENAAMQAKMGQLIEEARKQREHNQ